jgi:hypothetical protein
MDPAERVSFFARLGARRVPIAYVQPALARDSSRAHGLQLVALSCDGDNRTLPAAVVRDFLSELYEVSEGDPWPRDREFQEMMAELATESIELQPLNAILEDHAFKVDRYGIAFEFVTRGPRLESLPKPTLQFASFEEDVVSYAYRDRRRLTSRPIHVTDPCRRIEIQFAGEIRLVSEGRTCALVSERAPSEQHPICVQVRASNTRFRTGITVWHLVLTPQSGTSDVALTEYDVIKLAKLWMGGEEIQGPYAGNGPETAVRFTNGESVWTLRELARSVIGDELGDEAPRAGIIQLITADEDAEKWRKAWKAIRAAKDEPPIDTSFPFTSDEQRALVESVGGVIQALLDFREIDDAELRDVFGPIDVGEDGLQGVHKGTLVYMAASDRTWEVGKMSYGVSPYLLLPHALLLHNEEVLRGAASAVREARASARALAQARKALSGVWKKGRRRNPVELILSVLWSARAAARYLRDDRKKLRDVRERLRTALQRDYLPNLFHYPNERRIYEVVEASRGLSDLAQELRETLGELDARWEGGSSMRRTMADDLKAGLLFVVAGFALKDYLSPIALIVIFGLGGLMYVGFRFYTWR